MEATVPRPRATSKQEPRIVEMPRQKMAVVHTQGDPNVVGPTVLPALYGAVYALKFAHKKNGHDFKVAALRARWPDMPRVPKDQWHGIWGLPIPEVTTSLLQKVSGVEVRIEAWEYGIVAEILHRGPFSAEAPTVQRLHDFITENGYEIAGVHEEEYLTSLNAKAQKTIIRYPVRRKGAVASESG